MTKKGREKGGTKKASPEKKSAGHAEHTQDAAAAALPGEFRRPIKVTFLGAGSFFVPRVMNDIMLTPGQRGGTFAMVDVDEKRLNLTARMARRLVRNAAGPTWKIQASADREDVLAGSDYIISCIEVSGVECVGFDNDIPLKYGVDQCIGDTIGPGGLFKGLRTIPVFLEILKDCERLCPDALVLNYTNPMSMMCTAAGRASSMRVVGLCHSVQGTSAQLAKWTGVPIREMAWECAGINHLAWFTRLEHKGVDLYPRLKKQFAADLRKARKELESGQVPEEWLYTNSDDDRERSLPEHHRELVRKHMCIEFGAFITESSGHLSEYLPYYRKSEEGRKYLRCNGYGGSGFYSKNWPSWRRIQDEQRRQVLREKEPPDWKRSWEYASWIIEAIEKNSPFRIHGNVMNRAPGGPGRLISNLRDDQCVEVACLVDQNGVQPTRYGALPPQMAALCRSNQAMFDLAAEAAIHRRVESAVHALMLDPLTAAVCTPRQIRAMTLELFEAEKKFLPGYR